MYTRQALRELGVTPHTISDAQKKQLDDQGFFIVENVLTPNDCQLIRAEFERIHADEKGQGGHEVHIEPGARRISNIFNKTQAFDKCLWIPEVLAAAAYLLGEIKVHGANLRDPVKGYGNQDLHVDVPKKFADDWWVVNAHRAGLAQMGPDQCALRKHWRLGTSALDRRRTGPRAEGFRRTLSR
jgi:hypothetical protein